MYTRKWLSVGGVANVAALVSLAFIFELAKFNLGFMCFAAIVLVAGMCFAVVGLWPQRFMSEPVHKDVPRHSLHMTMVCLGFGSLYVLIAYFIPIVTRWLA